MSLGLGILAKDLASNFEGTITSKLEKENGTVRWGLTGKTTDPAQFPQEVWLEENRLQPVGTGISSLTNAPTVTRNISLGDTVEARGVEGEVKARITHFNGEVDLLVQGPSNTQTGEATRPFAVPLEDVEVT